MASSIRAAARVVLVGAALFAVIMGLLSTLLNKPLARKSSLPTTSGYQVGPSFEDFYAAKGGLTIFGYPITEQFVRPGSGLAEQYYQRAHMHCLDSGCMQITLDKLIDRDVYGQPPLPSDQIPAESPNVHYFPESGHTSGYAFLVFWNTRGGEPVFGYPITEPTLLNGHITQYFERAVMVWWPEREGNQRLQLEMIGESALKDDVEARRLGAGDTGSARYDGVPVTDLTLTLSLKHPITGQSGTQLISCLVTDQGGRPVPGAKVTVTVYSDISVHSYTDVPTSKGGFASLTFPVEPDRIGKTVPVVVQADYDGLSAHMETSYLVWMEPSQP